MSEVVSNISYTERDFNTIYPELLKLAKQLCAKWDPSISNESDPGVVLLKLNAILTDKLNYNIDKNILECFPNSVTQDSNARQLYQQLGYYMSWYRSATTTVTMSFTGDDSAYTDPSSSYAVIPKFTKVCDDNSEIMYTLTALYGSEENAAADAKLYFNGEPIVFNAIQGMAVSYDMNGETTLQVSDLDDNNRLYFPTNDIAENGIFITNADANNFASWVRKDNLAVENLGNTYYAFGVDPSTDDCYIEFPQDVDTIFKNGIQVTYIRTNGSSGDTSIGNLTQFYTDLTATTMVDGETSTLVLSSGDSGNVTIKNTTVGVGGADVEDIDDAYRNYKHTIGTYNTLITLRDYTNAVIGSSLASNAFVTDRHNDIQCCYQIMSSTNNVDTLVDEIDQHTDDEPCLNAYNLKIYALKYPSSTIDNYTDYKSSFSMLSEQELKNLKAYIEDQKAIPHDYSDILTPKQWEDYQVLATKPSDWDTNYSKYYKYVSGAYVQLKSKTTFVANTYFRRIDYFRSHICFFKNIYPITCTVTPSRTLSDTESEDVLANIVETLYKELNSQKVEFGDNITTNGLEEIIESADTRISRASILNVYYTTYAVYWNGVEFKEIDLTTPSDDTDNFIPYMYTNSNAYTYQTVRAATTFKSMTNEKWGYYKFTRINPSSGKGCWYVTYEDGKSTNTPFTITDTYTVDDETEEPSTSEIYKYVLYGTMPKKKLLKSGDWFAIEINPADSFRDEVYVKSILNGSTPLYVENNDLGYDINQIQSYSSSGESGVKEDVISLEGSVSISVPKATPYYRLRDNENLKFTTSNLIEGSSYSDYVKYFYYDNAHGSTPQNITANSSYILDANQYVFFFWKDSDDDEAIYKYHVYSKGCVICPTFEMVASSTYGEFAAIINAVENVGTDTNPRYETSTTAYRELTDAENTYAKSSVKQWLSGTKTVVIKYISAVTLGSKYYYYWALNTKTSDSKYVLFNDYSGISAYDGTKTYQVGDRVSYEDNYYECIIAITKPEAFNYLHWTKLPATEYTLQSGECLIYTSDPSQPIKNWNYYGVGTKIERFKDKTEWSVPVVTLNLDSDEDQIQASSCKLIPSESYMNITEQQFVNIGSGCSVYFDGITSDITIRSDDDIDLGSSVIVKYTTSTLSDSDLSDKSKYDSQLTDIGNVDTWKVRSALTLNLGANEEQFLLDGQSVKLNYIDDTYTTISGQAETDRTYPMVLQSVLPIDSSNATSVVYTFDYDDDGNVVGNSIYAYKKLKSFKATLSDAPTTVGVKIDYDTIDGSTVTFPMTTATDSQTAILKFSLPAIETDVEGYILGFYHPYEDLDGMSLTLDLSTDGGSTWTAMRPISSPLTTNFILSGVYYFNLPVETNTLYEIRVMLGGQPLTEDKAFTINKLYRYIKPSNVEDEDFLRYCNLIEQFDMSGRFQYTYKVPSDKLISDPLDSDSFLNYHHIYNAFTICQMNVKGINCNITTR